MISDIRPFPLCENVYFVGSSKVSVHIVRTERGLVMIDTGYPDMYEQILDSMREAALDPRGVCAIFHSHGHIDHFGCTPALKALSGAKTYISRIDNDIVNGKRDLSWAREIGMPTPAPFSCDVLVEDGDAFFFGSTKIRCKLTPGHTEGVLSFFIETDTEQGRLVCAMHGGIGMNSMKKDFLEKYGLSLDCRETFRQGLHELARERVDVVLGNHPGQSETQEKLQAYLSAGKSPIDPEEWKRFLLRAEEKLDAMLAAEKT